MSNKKVISYKNLPTRFPLQSTILYVMALFYFNAPQWLFGVVGVLLVLMWATWVYSVFEKEKVDVSELLEAGLDEKPEGKKSNFRKLLDEQLASAQQQREELEDKQ